MWASGTGFAGVFGYAWVAVGHYMLGLSFTTVLLGATCLAAGWWWTFSFALEHPRTLDSARGLGTSLRPSEPTAEAGCEGAPDTDAVGADREPLLGRGSPLPAAESLGVRPRARAATDSRASSTGRDVEGEGWEEERSIDKAVGGLRRPLWMFMVPLFVVYAAEYAMQTGPWSAMGFPVTDRYRRELAYEFATWMYQLGVFLARSSGMFWHLGLEWLWIMPTAQACLLVFFIANALWQWWQSWSLLSLCLVTGLLGGGVYVTAFTLIASHTRPEAKESSLYMAAMANTSGILVADVAGLFIQGCIFKRHGLPGAAFRCGAGTG